MAQCEVYIIKKRSRILEMYGEIYNATRGAFYIWSQLEDKYLEPRYYCRDIQERRFLSPDRSVSMEFWRLPFSGKMAEEENLVMLSTCDTVYIKREDLPRLAEAFRHVSFANKEMIERAAMFDEIYARYSNKEILGVYTLETNVISLSDVVAEYSKTDREHQRPHMRKDAVNLMDVLKK